MYHFNYRQSFQFVYLILKSSYKKIKTILQKIVVRDERFDIPNKKQKQCKLDNFEKAESEQ